jgi:hypothetical protein
MFRRAPMLAFGFPILALVAGCASQIAEPSGPSQGTTTMPESPASGEATDLTIVVRDGSSKTSTWRLTCDPPGGSHPDPNAACRALAANGAAALPQVPQDKVCGADLCRSRNGDNHRHLAVQAGHKQLRA